MLESPWARKSALDDVIFTFTMALKIMIYEPIVLSLGLFNGAYVFMLLSGILTVELGGRLYVWTRVLVP